MPSVLGTRPTANKTRSTSSTTAAAVFGRFPTVGRGQVKTVGLGIKAVGKAAKTQIDSLPDKSLSHQV